MSTTIVKLKPMGIAAVGSALLLLSFLAFRNAGAARVEAHALEGAGSGVTLASASSNSLDGGTEIYGDSLSGSWQQIGWSIDAAMDDPRVHHGGRTSIRVAYQPFGGLKFFHNAFSTKDYDRVVFYVLGSGNGGQHLAVTGTRTATDAKGSTGKNVVVDPLPSGRWVAVVVPLDQIGLGNVPDMTTFWVQETSGQSQTVFFDDIRLLHPGDPTPAGPIIPTHPE